MPRHVGRRTPPPACPTLRARARRALTRQLRDVLVAALAPAVAPRRALRASWRRDLAHELARRPAQLAELAPHAPEDLHREVGFLAEAAAARASCFSARLRRRRPRAPCRAWRPAPRSSRGQRRRARRGPRPRASRCRTTRTSCRSRGSPAWSARQMRTASQRRPRDAQHALAELERRRLDLLREQDFLLLREGRDLGDVAEVRDERSRARPSARSLFGVRAARVRTRTPIDRDRCSRPRRSVSAPSSASDPAPRGSPPSSSMSCLAHFASFFFVCPRWATAGAGLRHCRLPGPPSRPGRRRARDCRGRSPDPLCLERCPVQHGAASPHSWPRSSDAVAAPRKRRVSVGNSYRRLPSRIRARAAPRLPIQRAGKVWRLQPGRQWQFDVQMCNSFCLSDFTLSWRGLRTGSSEERVR